MMKAVKFKGDIEIEDVPLPPIPKDHVLVKILQATISPLERGLLKGVIWVQPERNLGMEGYGVLSELGIEVEDVEVNEEVLINSFIGNEILGVHKNGVLAEYVALPREAIEEAPPSVPEYAKTLASAGALATAIVDMISDKKTLLVGAGLTNVLISYLMSWEVPLLPWGNEPPIDMNYFPTTASACTQEWDVVVVSVPEASAVDTAAMCVREGGTIILHPLVNYSKHVFTGKRVEIKVPQPKSLKQGAEAISKMPWKVLSSLIDETSSLNDALSSSASRSLVRPEALEE